MDGTALYEAVAAIFIAQLNGRNLNFGEIITVRWAVGDEVELYDAAVFFDISAKRYSKVIYHVTSRKAVKVLNIKLCVCFDHPTKFSYNVISSLFNSNYHSILFQLDCLSP